MQARIPKEVISKMEDDTNDEIPNGPSPAYTAGSSKRNRDWEKRAREKGGVVTYRGIPTEMQTEIKKISDDLDVPIGDVVRALLEHGLKEYHNWFLRLTPKAVNGRRKLFDDDG
jgi:hypothetical protein